MDQVIALPLPTTPEEFLAWEELQEERYEFDGRAPVPMNGGTWRHALIESNIVGELRPRLRGSPFKVCGGTMKVPVGRAFRYPDACITGTPVPPGSITIPEPLILFEVVSPSSRVLDHVIKQAEYKSLPSVRRYVVVEQHEATITVHARDGAAWTERTLGPGDPLDLPEVGISLPVASLYEDVLPAS